MQRSNTYILFYTLALTVICGIVLSLTAMGLRPMQDANKEQERQINIVNTVMDTKGMSKEEIVKIYTTVIEGFVVDYNGKVVEGMQPGAVNLPKEYKKPLKERMFPVYTAKDKNDNSKVEFYIFPLYGFGLWNNISGYVSLQSDMNTINGINFGHVGETPGLGARISDDPAVTARYKGKKLFDDKGVLQSVVMQKGEGNDYSNDPHKVDGMSGATLTGKGVNNMLMDYFTAYQNYFKSNSNSQTSQK